MLARDHRLVLLPAAADLAHHRQEHAAKRRLDAECRERAVERGLRGDAVERVDRGRKLADERHDGSQVLRVLLREREPRRLGRRDAAVEVVAHRANSPGVFVRVEPEPARGALWAEQLVASLPRPERGLGHAGPPGELADAEVALHGVHCTELKQTLDKTSRPLYGAWTEPGQRR
jgi:hypothetical protein